MNPNDFIDRQKVAKAGCFVIQELGSKLNRAELMWMLGELLVTCFEEANFTKEEAHHLLTTLEEGYEPIN